MTGVWAVIWQSAVGTAVTAVIGVAATWLAHRKGWLGKPLGALAGWLRAEGGTISDDVVQAIVAELKRRQAERPAVTTPAEPAPPVSLQLVGPVCKLPTSNCSSRVTCVSTGRCVAVEGASDRG